MTFSEPGRLVVYHTLKIPIVRLRARACALFPRMRGMGLWENAEYEPMLAGGLRELVGGREERRR